MDPIKPGMAKPSHSWQQEEQPNFDIPNFDNPIFDNSIFDKPFIDSLIFPEGKKTLNCSKLVFLFILSILRVLTYEDNK